MKRRQVITGLMGITSALMVSPWRAVDVRPDSGKTLALNLPLTKIGEYDITPSPTDALDPLSDREQPVLADLIASMDSRDSNTMPVVSHADSSESHKIQPESKKVAENESASSPKEKLLTAQQIKQRRAVLKSIDFERDYEDDSFVTVEEEPVLQSLFVRLRNLQDTIGYGNFNIVSFDDALVYAKRFDAIGAFTEAEIRFIEKLYHTDAKDYGFYGQKVSQSLTQSYKKEQVVKIPRSGHYLLNDDSLEYYKKLRKEVGDSIILTSGIRSNIKQLYLFIAKTVRVNGNLSRASRSLAPVGYSYHGIGDFDVGRVGWGAKNFTDYFSETEEFKRMRDLGYVAIRYDQGNQLGVRFEPWHIKVV